MLDEKAKKVFQDQKTWFLATCGEELNVVPIGLTAVLDDGKMVLGDTGSVLSVANIKASGKAAIAAVVADPLSGYQVKGSAEYVEEGPIVEACQKTADEAFGGQLKVKGVMIITPEKCVSLI